MITTWIFVAFALFALGLLAYLARRNRVGRTSIDEAICMIRSLDIEAFRNLVNPAEEAFLRCNLSPKEFRVIKRERAWAALAYVRCAGRAAVLFARAGQAAQHSSDPQIAESGMQIANRALHLRLYSLQAGLRLFGQVILPGTSNWSSSPLIDEYERTAETLLRLKHLRNQRHVSI